LPRALGGASKSGRTLLPSMSSPRPSPKPDHALMLAGLGLVGFMARRARMIV
jgi:hypothetical protein